MVLFAADPTGMRAQHPLAGLRSGPGRRGGKGKVILVLRDPMAAGPLRAIAGRGPVAFPGLPESRALARPRARTALLTPHPVMWPSVKARDQRT